ncbi:MAG: phosphatidylserine decarboxylase family protein [bacterium]
MIKLHLSNGYLLIYFKKMLTKYGTSNIIIMLGLGIILIITGLLLNKLWISLILEILGILLIAFTLWFFRDPDRKIPDSAINDNSIILSPADGKVVEIVEETENVYLKDKCIRISIFLSPLDVHVNRSPVTGKIEYFKYHPGKYLVAWHPKSSSKNEQTHIGVINEHGKIFFKQIVGVLARRLVWDIKEGDSLKVGQRFGMMKFGSRMDISVHPNSEIKVKVGDKVIAGITEIAKLKK